MKRIVLCLTALLLLFASCNKECKIKYPKGVKPIDWENYNDVYTVYWNTIHLSSEPIVLQSDTIKITGWVRLPMHNMESYFNLVDDVSQLWDLSRPVSGPNIIVRMQPGSLREYLDTSDLTRQCFIEGVLSFVDVPLKGCKETPVILNVNDIYFK